VRRSTYSLGFALALLLPACTDGAGSGGGVDGGGHPPAGELWVGGAQLDGTGFVDHADGDTVDLVPGAQGGFHVWINVRVENTDGRLYVEREARRVADDVLVLRSPQQVMEVPEDAMSDWWESPTASPAFMCPTPIGVKVWGEQIKYTVRLTDEAGNVKAEDSLVLVPQCPADQMDFCLEICSG